MSEVDQTYFHAAKAPSRRFQQLAVLQNVPCIRALPVLDDFTAHTVTHGILVTKGPHITNKIIDKWKR